jgi:hypothetical protein
MGIVSPNVSLKKRTLKKKKGERELSMCCIGNQP